ncbi:MAG: hypothetical protein JHD16_04455, partial [Solirubrobacteraceae bacterium]|nr:hypothetical protein [Solirubrobacteraceae bacterium]
FALTEAQVGKTLQCRSFGSNAGGVSISKQSISAPVVAGLPPSSCNWRESIADMTVWYPTRVRRGSKMRVRFEVDFAEPTAERFTVGMQLFKQGNKKRKWTYKTHTIGYARSEHRRTLTIRVPRAAKLGYHRFQTNAWTSGTGADGAWALCDDMYVNFRTRVVR